MDRSTAKEYASLHLEGMIQQETKYWGEHLVRDCPYRSSKDPPPPDSTAYSRCITNSWRITMTQWYFSVADTFEFERGVVATALNFLDRVILENEVRNTFTTKDELQLTAVTSLYLAMKLHGEIDPPPAKKKRTKYERKKLTIQAFCILSKHQFDAPAIEAMERSLLSMLKWQLNPPDARAFIACMLELMPEQATYIYEWRCIFDIARYVVIDCYRYLVQRPFSVRDPLLNVSVMTVMK